MDAAVEGTRLSYFQESIWFIRKIDPSTGSFNIGRAWALEGELDYALLQRSLDLVAARHDILRSKVVVDSGYCYMVVAADRFLRCEITDFTGIGGEDATSRASALLQEDSIKHFDFESDPLVRVRVVRLTPRRAVLMVVKPHLITDEASLGIFIREWAALYSSLLLRTDGSLSIPEQFSVYAIKQREFCQSHAVARHLTYWRGLLSGAPASLGISRGGTTIDESEGVYAGAEARFVLSPDILTGINTIRRTESSTLYCIFLSAFAILLQQWCQQEDVVIGGLLSNRLTAASRSIIGPLVNTFAFRFRFSEMRVVRDVVAAARSLVSNAYRFCELPFERMVEELKSTHRLDNKFRLDAVFDYFAAPPTLPEFYGLKATPHALYRKRAQAVLTLKVWPEVDGMAVFFEYQRKILCPTDVQRLFSQFELLLRGMLQPWDTDLASLTIQNDLLISEQETALGSRVKEGIQEPGSDPTEQPTSIKETDALLASMSSIWARVFNIDRVDADDEFFKLGGHSLLAVQIVNYIWDELNIEIPMELIMTDTVTVRALSDHIYAVKDKKRHDQFSECMARPSALSADVRIS